MTDKRGILFEVVEVQSPLSPYYLPFPNAFAKPLRLQKFLGDSMDQVVPKKEYFLLQLSLNPQIYEILIAAIYQVANVYRPWSKHLYTVYYLNFRKILQGLCIPLHRLSNWGSRV